MVERGENLPLVLKAREEKIRAARSLDEFDGHLLIERAVSADRPEHVAHAAAGNFCDAAVWRDEPSDPAGGIHWVVQFVGSQRLSGGIHGAGFHEGVRFMAMDEEGFHFAAQFLIASASGGQERSLFVLVAFESGLAQLFDAGPALSVHRNFLHSFPAAARVLRDAN